MEIEVQLYGGLRERLGGANRLRVTLADGATVADLRTVLAGQHPTLAGLLDRVQVAVDLELATSDEPLRADREVALLPPVAGGAGDDAPSGAAGAAGHDGPTGAGEAVEGGVRILTGLRRGPFDVTEVAARVGSGSVGATVSFLGTVRDHADDLDGVVRLDYSAYEEMAAKVLAEIAAEIAVRHPAVAGLALLHAVGELAVGDHTILVVACAAHRAEAFDACRDALEEVKTRVPIWKREVTVDGAHRWVGLGPATTDPP